MARFHNEDFDDGKAIIETKFSNDGFLAGTSNKFITFEDSGGELGAVRSDGIGGIEYHSFTGGHMGQTLNFSAEDEGGFYEEVDSQKIYWKQGMIVRATGEMIGEGFARVLPLITIADQEKDTSVIGVFKGTEDTSNSRFNSQKPTIFYSSLGVGIILVTNKDGDVLLGDYLSSSIIPGYAKKQDDDLLHSYTVAKCTRSIDWAGVTDILEHNGSTYKWALVPCTYHCG
jgi:hypothetical protein